METESKKMEKKFGWYVVKVLAGAEQNIVHQIKLNYESAGIADDFVDIYYPFIMIESKRGKARQKTLYPGYIFIKMHMDDKSRDAVLSVPSVYSFVTIGARGVAKPKMLSEYEYQKMIAKINEASSANLEGQAFALGDSVEIKAGSFNGFKGYVLKIDTEKNLLTVSISVFKRETEVVVPFNEVEKVNNSNQ